MKEVLPSYYSSLSTFRKLFQKGIPILNYHIIAPLPRSKQLKGLFVPPKVFLSQLRELKNAGFSSTSLNSILHTTDNSKNQFAISFDDGFRSVFENAMQSLAECQFKAIQFLVPKLFGKSNEWDLVLGMKQQSLMDISQIREWLAEGHEIGSHTMSHPYLTRISLDQAREEIAASKKYLEDTFGRAVEHFCYPYGDYNKTVRQMVTEAGYHTACTVHFGVNSMATDPFTLCRIKGRHPTRKLRSIFSWLRA